MTEPLIVVTALEKEYRLEGKRLPVLRGIDLAVAAGEQLAICGESGAGKSTLLHIMGGLDRPTAGRVVIGGEDVFHWPDHRLALWRNEHVGFVFQFHHLLPEFSALENVAIPLLIRGDRRRKARETAAALLDRVGLGDRLAHQPGEMSGGEQQRVALARALVTRPAMMLADEPTGNLDRQTSREVEDLLFELNREYGMVLVIVTHSQRLAGRMRRTILLEDGMTREVSGR
ncbi:MAG: ABC transporter ATP-binding protein [Deltaproteobacteria bacterium]|nr:ABC transporter ATP-binding protein [Candidatus Anaeroferrophillacea bacterium]